MSNQVSGMVSVIEPTQTFGSKGFRKRTVVLEQDKGSFTNYVPIEFTRDSCDDVDELKFGDEITVAFRLNGRKWQKDESSPIKFFLSAEALSFVVDKQAGGGQSSQPATQSHHSEQTEDVPF